MKSNEEGSAIVEMSLSCAVLFAALIGVFQLSLMLYCYHFLSYAAREGARYAIVRGSDSCMRTGISTSNISDCNDTAGTGIVSHVQSLNFPGIDWTRCTTTNPCVSITWPNGTNAPGNPVRVQISYPYTLLIPWVKPLQLTMSSTSQMIITN
jgi:Flp pilus assembly protein TadG